MKIEKTIIIDEIETAKEKIINLFSEQTGQEMEIIGEKVINILDDVLNKIDG